MAVVIALLTLALAAADREAVELFAPLDPLEPLPVHEIDAPEGACDAEPVRPGVPLPCTGVAISYAASDYVALLEADLRALAKDLAEERRGRLTDRAVANMAVADARRRERASDSEARGLRVAAPAALVGGALLTIGTLWAADRALAR